MMETGSPLLEMTGISKTYAGSGMFASSENTRPALSGISLEIGNAESLGIVGESGSGKTTLARIAAALLIPSAGKVLFSGTDLFSMGEGRRRPLRRRFQIIFQDPFASLNPRMKTLSTVAEPLIYNLGLPRNEALGKSARLLETVGITEDLSGRYPHELSGGQRQRVAIARSLATDPELLIADEPVSSLDVSVQAQILNLLKDIQERTGCSLMFISHDLRTISYMCPRLIVLHAGRIVESGNTGEIYGHPLHPYTRRLLESIPVLMGTRKPIDENGSGTPDRGETGAGRGCSYAYRCPIAKKDCLGSEVELREVQPGRKVACLYAG